MLGSLRLNLQMRDYDVMRGLFESRVMTTAHIAALYFSGSKEAAKKRLQKLKASGFIKERKRRVSEPAVLYLTRKGHSVLTQEDSISGLPKLSPVVFEKRANVSALTIRHELEVMDVKAALYSALKKSETFNVAEFSTWPRLHEFKASRPGQETDVLVKPDGFVRIHEKEKDGGVSEHTFFLEVDRSTETQGTLIDRAGCYLDYYKSGGFAVRNGEARSDYKNFPFRVLFVMKSEQRRDNTAARLVEGNPPIRTLVYLSTFPEVLADPVGKVWIRPVDYSAKVMEAISAKQWGSWHYRPSSKREIPAQQVPRISLF